MPLYKSDKLLVHPTAWMSLIDVLLTERNQTQRVLTYDSIYMKFMQVNINQGDDDGDCKEVPGSPLG